MADAWRLLSGSALGNNPLPLLLLKVIDYVGLHVTTVVTATVRVLLALGCCIHLITLPRLLQGRVMAAGISGKIFAAGRLTRGTAAVKSFDWLIHHHLDSMGPFLVALV